MHKPECQGLKKNFFGYKKYSRRIKQCLSFSDEEKYSKVSFLLLPGGCQVSMEPESVELTGSSY